MTKDEAKEIITQHHWSFASMDDEVIEAVECLMEDAEPCDDCISRQAVIDGVDNYIEKAQSTSVIDDFISFEELVVKALPPVTPKQKIGRCKDCKWWKDSDGLYRRGGYAESQCPINRREVFEGNGYCYMYEPQESEVTDADSD